MMTAVLMLFFMVRDVYLAARKVRFGLHETDATACMTKSCWHLPERFPKWLYSLALLFYGLLVHALRLQAGVASE